MSKIDFSKHPCFSKTASHKYARLHLPVAKQCNVQCNFCNRKYDCVNESRPGVTSAVLKPQEALEYCKKAVEKIPEVAVIGIAGPGDAFANPQETLETMRLVKNHFPEMLLCLATNGLALEEYIEDLKPLNVSHITVTVNALTAKTAAKIYKWVRDGKRIYRGEQGANLLLKKQISAIKKAKEAGFVIKINTILIPGVNDHEVVGIAKNLSQYGVDIFNIIPLHPAGGSDFENLSEPEKDMVDKLRAEAGKYIHQMTHCARCRADAAGLLSEGVREGMSEIMESCCSVNIKMSKKVKKRVAAATLEGVIVNQHLGSATEFNIFEKGPEGPQFVETRKSVPAGGGDERWDKLAEVLHDCHTVLVEFAGDRPKFILEDHGIEVLSMKGLLKPALEAVFDNRPLPGYLTCKIPDRCTQSGCGNGDGCGG